MQYLKTNSITLAFLRLSSWSNKLHGCFSDLFLLLFNISMYKLNILSNAVFLHRVHTKTSLPVFTGRFQKISHLYSVRSSTLKLFKI